MNDNESHTMYDRTIKLLGVDSVDKLKEKHIVICGIGGVGSYVVEICARIGIGEITVIDKDVVDISNINRQIIALNSTINMSKVEVAKNRILDINKEAKLHTIYDNITKDNISSLLNFKNIDYVVDAVDNFEAKIAIIKYCHDNNIKCISSMGMGNRLNPLDIKVGDIYETSVCPLARKVRKELKGLGIKKQKVIYSIEVPITKTKDKVIGSVPFVPSVAGIVIASEIIKDIIKK